MTTLQLAFLGLLFLAVFGAVMLALRLFAANPVQSRLDAIAGRPAPVAGGEADPWVARIIKLTGPLARLSLPNEGWETSTLRTRFMNAVFMEKLLYSLREERAWCKILQRFQLTNKKQSHCISYHILSTQPPCDLLCFLFEVYTIGSLKLTTSI